jgi:hypothetical protein
VCINGGELTSWTGKTLLASKTQNADTIPVDEFLQMWKDHLPEPWIEKVSLEMLKGSFVQPTALTIQYRIEADSNKNATAKAATSKSGNRKWHEKFKGSRK